MGLPFMLLAPAALATRSGGRCADAIGRRGGISSRTQRSATQRTPSLRGGLRTAGEQARDLFIAGQSRAFGLAAASARHIHLHGHMQEGGHTARAARGTCRPPEPRTRARPQAGIGPGTGLPANWPRPFPRGPSRRRRLPNARQGPCDAADAFRAEHVRHRLARTGSVRLYELGEARRGRSGGPVMGRG